MTRTFVVAVALSVVLIGDRTIPAAEDSWARTVITFEDTTAGDPPKGFTIGVSGDGTPASWVAEDDPSAPSGVRVLVQKSTDTAGSRFPICIYDTISTVDGSFSVAFKPVSGKVDQAAGLVWRYANPANYYLVRANALEGNVVLYKVENGKRSDLKPLGGGLFSYGRKATVDTGRWQTLGVDVRGSRFAVSLDGKHLFDVEDTTFRSQGKIGVWTKADSVSAFDDLTIQPHPGAPGG